MSQFAPTPILPRVARTAILGVGVAIGLPFVVLWLMFAAIGTEQPPQWQVEHRGDTTVASIRDQEGDTLSFVCGPQGRISMVLTPLGGTGSTPRPPSQVQIGTVTPLVTMTWGEVSSQSYTTGDGHLIETVVERLATGGGNLGIHLNGSTQGDMLFPSTGIQEAFDAVQAACRR